MELIKKQTKIYYIFNFVNRFMVYLPVFVLFLYQKNLSQAKVMVLISAYNIAILLGEVPTGIIADKFSRKLSVFLGCIIQGVAMILMIPTKNYYLLVILEACFGIGMTFQSGAMSAMLYDFLKNQGYEELYASIEGKRWASVFISQATASVMGGYLATIDVGITVFITGGVYILSAFILLLFNEDKEKEIKSAYRKHVLATGKNMLLDNRVRFMLIIIVLTNSFFQITLWFYQPYYQAIGINVSAYGLAYLLMNAVSALGGMLSSKLKLSMRQTICLYLFGNSILILFMGMCNSPIGVILPSFIFLVNGIANPWIQSYWEKNINNEERATASSILSLISSLVFALIAIPLGMICDGFGVNKTLLLAAGFFVCLSLLIYFIFLLGGKKNELYSE